MLYFHVKNSWKPSTLTSWQNSKEVYEKGYKIPEGKTKWRRKRCLEQNSKFKQILDRKHKVGGHKSQPQYDSSEII